MTTQHLSPPAQRCVSSKSLLGSFLSSPCRGQWGLSVLAPSVLGRRLIPWVSCVFMPPGHPRSVSGAPTALVSYCLSLYIFLIFCLCVSVSLSLSPSHHRLLKDDTFIPAKSQIPMYLCRQILGPHPCKIQSIGPGCGPGICISCIYPQTLPC